MKVTYSFLNIDSFLEKVYFLFLLLIVLSLPLHNLINSYVIVFFSVTALIYILLTRSYKKKYNNKLFLISIGFYAVHFLAYFTSKNLEPFFFDLEQKASLLVFPLAIGLSPTLSKKRLNIIFTVFISTTFIVSLATFRGGFYTAWKDAGLYDNLIVHRPYLGMYVVISIFLLIEFLKKGNPWSNFAIVMLVLCFILFLIVIIAKMAVLVIIILLLFYYFLDLYFKKKFKSILCHLLFIIIVLSGILLSNHGLRNNLSKVIHLKNFSWEEYDARIVNSVNIRNGLWRCSSDLLSRNYNWLFGVGTGDVKNELNECFREKIGPLFLNFDPHNQYLSLLLNIGIIGLLMFLVLLFLPIRQMLIVQNKLGLIFLSALFIFCFSESILGVQKGVVFYSLFYSILILNPYEKSIST